MYADITLISGKSTASNLYTYIYRFMKNLQIPCVHGLFVKKMGPLGPKLSRTIAGNLIASARTWHPHHPQYHTVHSNFRALSSGILSSGQRARVMPDSPLVKRQRRVLVPSPGDEVFVGVGLLVLL